MSKVAIYGDSYGSDYLGWPKVLEDILKCEKIDIYAVPGTSADYSYMKFLQTHEKYDLIIFLWTRINRSSLIIRENDDYKFLGGVFGKVLECSLRDIVNYNDMLKNNFNIIKSVNIKILNWIKGEFYFLSLYDTKNYLFNKSMRDSVKLIRPDSINIECFSGISESISCNNVYGIHNIFSKQLENLNLKFEFVRSRKVEEDNKKIKNHMTMDQNIEFAKYLHQNIIDKNFDIHKTFSDPEKYYTIAKTIEESGLYFV